MAAGAGMDTAADRPLSPRASAKAGLCILLVDVSSASNRQVPMYCSSVVLLLPAHSHCAWFARCACLRRLTCLADSAYDAAAASAHPCSCRPDKRFTSSASIDGISEQPLACPLHCGTYTAQPRYTHG